MRLRALITALLLTSVSAGCAFPEEPTPLPDRGPPRLLDDGSQPLPNKDCATAGEEIGWNASFYNVGGPGRIYLALFVNGDLKAADVAHVEGDQQHHLKLSWAPEAFGEFQTELKWGSSGSTDGMNVTLAGPAEVAYPCGIHCAESGWTTAFNHRPDAAAACRLERHGASADAVTPTAT